MVDHLDIAINDFLFRNQPLDPSKIICLVKRMVKGLTVFPKDMTENEKREISKYPKVISNDDDL